MHAKNKYIFPLSVVLCVVGAVLGIAYNVSSQDQQQVAFITGFYRNYLSMSYMKRGNYAVPHGSFYSNGAEALIATNARLCASLSRSDDICGYGADGDVFLNAQEIDSKLTFAKSGFKAAVAGKNMVDVFFNVYPEYGPDYDRKIRYVLVKENGGWRVDDVFFGEEGRFPVKQSMRGEINEENQRVLQDASEISEAAFWVFSYLRESDMLNRAERFMAFPAQVCSETGNCETLQKGDARLRKTMLTLHKAYFNGDSDNTTALDGYLPQPGQVRAELAKSIKLDALEFTYQYRAWWITKIDLTRLGSTVPIQRKHNF